MNVPIYVYICIYVCECGGIYMLIDPSWLQ